MRAGRRRLLCLAAAGAFALAAVVASATSTVPAQASPAPQQASVRGDLNRDGFADLAVGIVNGNGGVGAVEVMYGSPSGLSTTASQYWTLGMPGVAGPSGASGDLFGASVATGDFNGDGYADLAVGAPGANGVLVLYGSAHGLRARGSQFLHGSTLSGFSLATGDFNVDGYDDLAVGQPFAKAGQSAAGSVAIHYGSGAGLGGVAAGTAQLFSETTPGMPTPAPSLNDNFGLALASGRFSGGKTVDLAIGIPNSQGYGAVVVVTGSKAGLTTAGSEYIESSLIYGSGGNSLAAADFNGDGFDDLVVGEPSVKTSSNDAGAIEIHYGSSTGLRNIAQGTAKVLAEISPGMPGPPTADSDRFAYSLATGDFNRDGFADLAVGIAGKSSAIVLYGSGSGLFTRRSQYLAGVGPQVTGPFDGESVATAAGDYDGNGFADLVLGEPLTDTTQPGAGVIEVHPGSGKGLLDVPQGTAPLFSEGTAGMAGAGPGTDDNFGFSLASAG